MWLSDNAVRRPVVALVFALLLCIFGLVSFSKLPVREMPDVQRPVVTVSTSYQGAAASIMEGQITQVLEDEITGISGIDEITSISRNGISRITINFEYGWNMLEGISDVRDAVARAQRRLPEDTQEPIVSRDNGNGRPDVYLNLKSSTLDRMQLTDYAERVLQDRFSLLTGVSSVSLSGALYKVMYLELDPLLMAGRQVTTQDILAALRKENLELPSGEIRNDTSVMSVRVQRLYQTPQDFSSLVIKNTANDAPIYLKDVAKVFIGAENENSSFKSDGELNLSIGIITQSDANPLQVAQAVIAEVEKMQKFLPEGTELTVNYDSTVFIKRSVEEVFSTLVISGLLVVLVLYIFIGQLRATLIPAITVPVSLISAFIAAYMFGYSINLLTLMALILAIGLVVDDAIVVIENIFHHIDRGEAPLLAAYRGTKEVGFAVMATTAVLVMVFLPISFMDGMVGLLFTEFSVMLSIAVIFSSLIALTLTPVMSSFLLKANVKPGRFNQFINHQFDKLEAQYRRWLSVALNYRFIAPIIIIACLLGCAFLIKHLPAQLTPQEDRGVLFAFVKGAEGTSYNRMTANMDIVQERLMPLLGQGVLRSFNMQAPAFGGRAGDQTGFVIMILEDWDKRTVSGNQALGIIAKALKDIPDVKVWPMMPGFRGQSSEPVQFILSGADYDELYHWANQLKLAAETKNSNPLITNINLDYAQTTPELVVNIDRQRAAELGISTKDISDTLAVMLGGRKETTYVERGREYDVYLRANELNFASATDLSKIYLRSSTGQLITLDSLANIDEQASAQKLSHSNKQKSITLSANLATNATLGEALDYLDSQAISMLPADISIDYAGESKEFKENQNNMAMVFALALLVAYLVLAAQFESFINPFVVMLTVPMGILGGLIGLLLTHQGLNIYSQIGMIMLIGMVTKNGILIVEFANQLRDRGAELTQAIIDGASRRLRPILMTTFTTVAGAIPLLLSNGAGYESRVAVGTVIFFGMSLATIITLFVIPAMYRLVCVNSHSPGYIAKKLVVLETQTLAQTKE